MATVVFKYGCKLPAHRGLDPPDYTYRLQAWGVFTIHMPDGAKVLKVTETRDEIQVWALVDKANPARAFSFYYVGTGCHVDPLYLPHLTYVDTLALLGGNAVFHFFLINDTFSGTRVSNEN